jgi:hypothetical protein
MVIWQTNKTKAIKIGKLADNKCLMMPECWFCARENMWKVGGGIVIADALKQVFPRVLLT